MGVQVLPLQPDKFLDATAGYGMPQKAAHDNLIMLKQYTVVSWNAPDMVLAVSAVHAL